MNPFQGKLEFGTIRRIRNSVVNKMNHPRAEGSIRADLCSDGGPRAPICTVINTVFHIWSDIVIYIGSIVVQC